MSTINLFPCYYHPPLLTGQSLHHWRHCLRPVGSCSSEAGKSGAQSFYETTHQHLANIWGCHQNWRFKLKKLGFHRLNQQRVDLTTKNRDLTSKMGLQLSKKWGLKCFNQESLLEWTRKKWDTDHWNWGTLLWSSNSLPWKMTMDLIGKSLRLSCVIFRGDVNPQGNLTHLRYLYPSPHI